MDSKPTTTPTATTKPVSRIPSGIPKPGSTTATTTTPTASNIKRLSTTGASLGEFKTPSAIATTHAIPKLAQSTSNTRIATATQSSVEKPSGIRPPIALTKSASVSNGVNVATQPPQQDPNVQFSLKASNESLDQVGNGDQAKGAPNKDNDLLKLKIKDLEEKLETLKVKRAEDRDKLREYDKVKLQIQQLQEFKTKAQQEISDLNKELVQAKHDSKLNRDQYEAYKDEMMNHEQRIEEITVDKELAEAKIEELQDDMMRIRDRNEELQLELDVIKGEIELNGISGVSSNYQFKQAEMEQERLKSALIKLRDLSLQDKAEINNLRKLNDEQGQKLKAAQKECELVKQDNVSYESQIVDLKDQITATLGSVQMIEQLTEQNLDLEAKIQSLSEQIADLEAINDVNDQLQENAREEERELRESLDLAEGRIREFEKQLESLKYTIADHEKTLLKYRDLVRQLQNDNDKLTRQWQSKLDDEKQNANTQQVATNFDFKTVLFETKNYAKYIENEANKIEITSFKKYTAYLLSFMNDQFMKRGGDHEAIQTMLLFKRLRGKSEFLIKEIREKYPIAEKLSRDEMKTNVGELTSFIHTITMYLQLIQLYATRYDNSLTKCSMQSLYNLASMYLELNIHEKTLDTFVDYLQKSQLDETNNLETLEKTCLQLAATYKNHLNAENYDHYELINELSKYGAYASEIISFEIQRIQSYVQAKDTDSSEVFSLLKELFNINDLLKSSLKKLNRLLPKNERKYLCLNKNTVELVDNSIRSFYKLTKCLHDLCQNASMLNVFSAGSGDTQTDTVLNGKKLEDLLYQVCDMIYTNDDAGPFDSMRHSIEEVLNTLNRIAAILENGECEREFSEEEFKLNSPIVMAADAFKNTLIEAESIKYKLESKDDEIKELKKHLKFKTDELSENKVRLSLMDKKMETLQKESDEKSNKLQQGLDELKQTTAKTDKEHLDTIEALQQEIDTLQNERRDLKEKLRQYSKRNLLEGILSRQTSETPKSPTSDAFTMSARSSHTGGESTALVEELKLMRNMVQLLEENNNELKFEKIKEQAQNLPDLPLIKKPIGLQSQTGFANIGYENEQIANLHKQSSDLIKEFYASYINIKVPEIAADSKVPAKKAEFNLQTKVQMKQLTKKANSIKTKLNELRTKLTPGTHVKTNLNIFETPEYSKNRESGGDRLVAEIRLPCRNGNSKTIDLHLDNSEIKDVLKHLTIVPVA